MTTIVDEIRKVVDLVRQHYILADTDEVSADDTTITADAGSAPYYLFGHRLEIATRTQRKERDKVFKVQKYPLIALRLDTSERMIGDVAHYSLNIGIINRTKANFTSDQRIEEVFKPLLYPLYELFFEKLREVGFMWPGNLERPEHEKIDRLFWGIQGAEKNEKNIFNEPVDAVEIIDMQVNKTVHDHVSRCILRG